MAQENKKVIQEYGEIPYEINDRRSRKTFGGFLERRNAETSDLEKALNVRLRKIPPDSKAIARDLIENNEDLPPPPFGESVHPKNIEVNNAKEMYEKKQTLSEGRADFGSESARSGMDRRNRINRRIQDERKLSINPKTGISISAKLDPSIIIDGERATDPTWLFPGHDPKKVLKNELEPLINSEMRHHAGELVGPVLKRNLRIAIGTMLGLGPAVSIGLDPETGAYPFPLVPEPTGSDEEDQYVAEMRGRSMFQNKLDKQNIKDSMDKHLELLQAERK